MPNLCKYCGSHLILPSWKCCDRKACRRMREREYGRKQREKKRLTKKKNVLEMELTANQVEQ